LQQGSSGLLLRLGLRLFRWLLGRRQVRRAGFCRGSRRGLASQASYLILVHFQEGSMQLPSKEQYRLLGVGGVRRHDGLLVLRDCTMLALVDRGLGYSQAEPFSLLDDLDIELQRA
jgi:hypothetical protein